MLSVLIIKLLLFIALSIPFLIQNISFVIVLWLCGGGRKELAKTLIRSTFLLRVAFWAVARAMGAVRLV